MQDTGGRASITGDGGLFQLQKCPKVRLESVREDLHSCALSRGESMDAASLAVALPPPSSTSYQNATRK